MHKTRRIDLRITEDEYRLIRQKMAQCKIVNLSAYLIKMAIDGNVINLDIPELKEISRLLRYNGNNINQIAKRLKE
ncbi:MAG: plasmid mobilization protein, partial [Ruminococcus sp.]